MMKGMKRLRPSQESLAFDGDRRSRQRTSPADLSISRLSGDHAASNVAHDTHTASISAEGKLATEKHESSTSILKVDDNHQSKISLLSDTPVLRVPVCPSSDAHSPEPPQTYPIVGVANPAQVTDFGRRQHDETINSQFQVHTEVQRGSKEEPIIIEDDSIGVTVPDSTQEDRAPVPEKATPQIHTEVEEPPMLQQWTTTEGPVTTRDSALVKDPTTITEPATSTNLTTADPAIVDDLESQTTREIIHFDGDPALYEADKLWYSVLYRCLTSVGKSKGNQVVKQLHRFKFERNNAQTTLNAICALVSHDIGLAAYLQTKLGLLDCYINETARESIWDVVTSVTHRSIMPSLESAAPENDENVGSCLTCVEKGRVCDARNLKDSRCPSCNYDRACGEQVECYWKHAIRGIYTFQDAVDLYGHSDGNAKQKQNKTQSNHDTKAASSRSRNAFFQVSGVGKYPAQLRPARLCSSSFHSNENGAKDYKPLDLTLIRTDRKDVYGERVIDYLEYRSLKEGLKWSLWTLVLTSKSFMEFKQDLEYKFYWRYDGSKSDWSEIMEDQFVDWDSDIRDGTFYKKDIEFRCVGRHPRQTQNGSSSTDLPSSTGSSHGDVISLLS